MQEPIIKLNGWKTIKDYAAAKGITTQVATNWIARGKLQVRAYPELNNLRLVKDKND